MSDTVHVELSGLMPTAIQATAPITRQVKLARNTYAIRLECPQIAEQILPGQFFMVRLPHTSDPLLGRPFALYDVWSDAKTSGVEFAYIVMGKQTARLCELQSGDHLELWGPLGNGFPVPTAGHLVMVAGGIGQTPFLAVAREALGLRQYGNPPRTLTDGPSKVTLCYGVRSADYLAGLDDFRMDGLDVRLATDDGTHGHHGFVSDLLVQTLEASTAQTHIYCCGPERMMETVAHLAARFDVPCWLSLETPMACGFGACFSCVTRIRLPNGDWDYRRTCVEGPVFPANQLML